MTQDEIKNHIDAIIRSTFKALRDVFVHQKEGSNHNPIGSLSRIAFPLYSDGKTTRLSEQELRFVFVEVFNKYCREQHLNWFYSVETPTKYKYKFSNRGSKIEPKLDNDNGQSAMVDLAIHDADLNRLALFEFKALNPDASCFAKDFVKLENEPDVLTYFLMYVKSHNIGTIKSLNLKIEKKASTTEFVCYDLITGKPIQKEIISFNKNYNLHG